MRKNLAKIIALLMALVLVFSFAACGGDEDPTETNTENGAVTEDAAAPGGDIDATGDTDASGDASDTLASGETAAEGESKNEADNNGGSTSTGGAIAQPTTTAEGVKVFNDALAKVSSTTTYVDRKLTKQNLTIVGDLNSLGPVSDTFEKGSGNVNVKLSSLSASSVSSFSCTPSGNNYIMTFKLNTLNGGKGGSQNLKHGQGGYMYFLTMDEVSSVVNQIGKQIGGDSFEVNIKKADSEISLQGGQLVVTVDKTTGKMSKAVLDFTEVITGKCQTSLLGPITVTADLVGVGKVTFTLK